MTPCDEGLRFLHHLANLRRVDYRKRVKFYGGFGLHKSYYNS